MFIVHRARTKLAVIVLDLIHPGHFRALPPSPCEIGMHAEFAGIAKFEEVVRSTPVYAKQNTPMRYI